MALKAPCSPPARTVSRRRGRVVASGGPTSGHGEFVGAARRLFVGPGLSWSVTDDVALDFGVRIPVWRRTETKLSDSNAVWQVGVSWRF